jgi:hypothetical protein
MGKADTSLARQPVNLGWQMQDLGYSLVEATPDWLKAYSGGGGGDIRAVMELYPDDFCFVVYQNGPNYDFIRTWGQSYEITQQVGQMLSTGIANTLQAAQQGTQTTQDDAATGNDSQTADLTREIQNRLGTNITTIVTGITRQGEFWSQMRRYDPDDPSKHADTYNYYALYTIDRELLDKQILDTLKANAAQLDGLAGLTASNISAISAANLKANEANFASNALQAPEQREAEADSLTALSAGLAQ